MKIRLIVLMKTMNCIHCLGFPKKLAAIAVCRIMPLAGCILRSRAWFPAVAAKTALFTVRFFSS
jgi:hypothetical protein